MIYLLGTRLTLCKKKIAWQPIFIFRSNNVRMEKRQLTVESVQKKLFKEQRQKSAISDEMYLLMVPNLFACIITSNFYSKNVTLLYTGVCFYEITLYFWIFNFQAFHVNNIKSRWKRIDIRASDSENFWSAYFSSFSLVSSNFCRFLDRVTIFWFIHPSLQIVYWNLEVF